MSRFEKLLTIFSPASSEEFFQTILESNSTVNEYSFEFQESSHLTLEEYSQHRKQIHIDFKQTPVLIQLYSSQQYIKSPKNKPKFLSELVANKISQLHQYFIETLKQEVLVESIHKVESELETEIRGLEWLRVSIEVLRKAISHCHQNSEYKYTQKSFLSYPSKGCELRLVIMSLDFKIEFLRDSRLKVTCWDYKDYKETNPDPSFIGTFYHRKNQVVDLFIPLLIDMSRASTKIRPSS